MSASDIRGREEQGATFVELFFDLVFVFAVTQVTGVLSHDLTPLGVLRGLIIFWLVWWAWTQFTWSLNEADTEHPWVRMFTLVSTGVAFLMALTVPLVAQPSGWLFPVAYLVLRATGIALQRRLAGDDPARMAAVRIWTVSSSIGLVAVLAAIVVTPELRYSALGLAAILDIAAAMRAGRYEWRLFSGHFSERHGLFVIIALGESLIATGVGVAGNRVDAGVAATAVAAITATCALWWTYFGWVNDALEERLAAQEPRAVGRFARDVYSFGHFPLIFGIISFAAGLETAIHDPGDPLGLPRLLALSGGVALILAGTAVALLLARIRVSTERVVVALILVALIPVLAGVPAWAAMWSAASLVTLLAVRERRPAAAVTRP